MVSGTPINSSVTIASRSRAIEDTCKTIISQLETGGFAEDDVFAVHLAVKEALLNAVLHGNQMDEKKKVRIDYTLNDEMVEIFIADEGSGFDPCSVPDPRCEENIFQPDGRGLLLIRHYMDTVEFNECGNRIHMIKHNSKKSQEKCNCNNKI